MLVWGVLLGPGRVCGPWGRQADRERGRQRGEIGRDRHREGIVGVKERGTGREGERVTERELYVDGLMEFESGVEHQRLLSNNLNFNIIQAYRKEYTIEIISHRPTV